MPGSVLVRGKKRNKGHHIDMCGFMTLFISFHNFRRSMYNNMTCKLSFNQSFLF